MAKSAAERQQEYREKRRLGRNNEYRINTWVNASVSLSLDRMARHHGVTKREMIERLVTAADDLVIAGLEMDTPEWNDYFGVTQ